MKKMRYETPNMEIVYFENGIIDTTDASYEDSGSTGAGGEWETERD